MKKALISLLVLAVLLTPTYLAIRYWNLINGGFTFEAISNIKLITTDNREKEVTDRGDMRFYYDMVQNTSLVNNNGLPIESQQPIRIVFQTLSSQTAEYKLYLSTKADNCLVLAPDGSLLKLSEKNATELLKSEISDSLYAVGTLPNASFLVDDQSTPIYASNYEWLLKRGDDKYQPTSLVSDTKSSNKLRIFAGSSVAIKYATAPDVVDVQVQSGAEVIFDGMYDDFIANFTFNKDAALKYTVNAEWKPSASSDYSGKATYVLDVTYDVPAVFSISDSEAKPGQIIFMTAQNINEGESISVTAESGLNTAFITTAKHHTAILPIGIANAGKTLPITVRTSDNPNPVNYSITVGALPNNSYNYGAQDDILRARKTAASAEERRQNFLTLSKVEENKKLWTGSFIKPCSGDIKIGFGTAVTINKGNGYINEGMDISVSAGAPIYASNSGKVVFAASLTETGNTVVIEHGFGIKTWYCHLDSIGVNVGDAVEKQQEIGKGGKTGFVSSLQNHLYFAVSIKDVFVDPAFLLEHEITGIYNDEEAAAMEIDSSLPPFQSEGEQPPASDGETTTVDNGPAAPPVIGG